MFEIFPASVLSELPSCFRTSRFPLEMLTHCKEAGTWGYHVIIIKMRFSLENGLKEWKKYIRRIRDEIKILINIEADNNEKDSSQMRNNLEINGKSPRFLVYCMT